MVTTTGVIAPSGELAFNRPSEETLLVRLAGDWTIDKVVPSPDEVKEQIKGMIRKTARKTAPARKKRSKKG